MLADITPGDRLLVFGRIGDRVGRKYPFLMTLSGMGLSTALIGVVPTYAEIGIVAAMSFQEKVGRGFIYAAPAAADSAFKAAIAMVRAGTSFL